MRCREHCWCVVQATLAACNVAARLSGHPVWSDMDVLPFVDGPFESIPKASPSIVNASELKLEQVHWMLTLPSSIASSWHRKATDLHLGSAVVATDCT